MNKLLKKVLKKQLQKQDINCEKFSFKEKEYYAKCVKVVDGDTIHVVFKTKYGMKRFVVRILYVDTPELRKHQESGRLAKLATENFVLNKICKVKCGDYDAFGRLLGEISVDGIDLGEYLLKSGFAVRY